MMLQFSNHRKILWNLENMVEDIDRTIAQTNLKRFERQLESLYPKLQKYGLILMVNDPPLYLGMWFEYQVEALEYLSHHVREGTFDVEEWNANVERINTALKRSL